MSSHAISASPETEFLANVTVGSRNHAISASLVTAFLASVTVGSRSHAISASPANAFLASVTIGSRSHAISASPANAFLASVTIGSRSHAISARPETAFLASVTIGSRSHAISASPANAFLASVTVGSRSRAISASPVTAFLASVGLTGASDTRGLSLCSVVREILNLWGIEGTCNAPDFAIERAIGDVNSAMQTVWNQSSDRSYWSNQTLTITIANGATSQDLPDNIQNVIGPCRREDNRRPLATLNTIGELETFADIYLDGATSFEPLAYHIERLNQTGSDPAKTIFHVTPAVQGVSVSFLLRVVIEAPRYTVGDLATCPVVPIPHSYVESLLLPIARHRASSFWLFTSAESKESIDQEYQQAMASIGMADPLPDSTKGESK